MVGVDDGVRVIVGDGVNVTEGTGVAMGITGWSGVAEGEGSIVIVTEANAVLVPGTGSAFPEPSPVDVQEETIHATTVSITHKWRLFIYLPQYVLHSVRLPLLGTRWSPLPEYSL